MAKIYLNLINFFKKIIIFNNLTNIFFKFKKGKLIYVQTRNG